MKFSAQCRKKPHENLLYSVEYSQTVGCVFAAVTMSRNGRASGDNLNVLNASKWNPYYHRLTRTGYAFRPQARAYRDVWPTDNCIAPQNDASTPLVHATNACFVFRQWTRGRGGHQPHTFHVMMRNCIHWLTKPDEHLY